MGELEKYNEQLPATIEGLRDFILIGKERLKVHQAKIRAIDRVPTARDARNAALEDGQDAAISLICAEAQLGALLEKIDKKESYTAFSQRKPVLPEGINWKLSHEAQTISKNPEKVQNSIDKFVKEGKIPTPDSIYKDIKKEERNEEIEKQKEEISQIDCRINGLYDIIIIDPPWNYGREYDLNGSRVANPYPEMNFDELSNINIPAEDNCIMWLWTTHAFIWDAKELMNLWGFEYKAILVWNKVNMGMGAWLRMQCEFCLLGIKGNPLWDARDIKDIITEQRREHSRKPDAFYEMIIEKFVGKKLDYFSREQRDGFDSFGNDTNKF